MSASLQASARAAYRDLWRASRFTFAGMLHSIIQCICTNV